MALQITEVCVSCWACETVCPSDAVRQVGAKFSIDKSACDECLGAFADPQCASICPVEGAIADSLGQPLHSPGSLTGITPKLLAAIAPERVL